MKTIRHCSNRFEAEVLKGNLENGGFHPVIFDCTMDMVLPNITCASGILKVVVPDEEYGRAKEYLKKEQNDREMQEES